MRLCTQKKYLFAKDEATGKLYFIVDGVSYSWVDLGLPSGFKWADRNVGAETPQDNGLYFSWGNIDGHAVDENGNVTDGYSFYENTYPTTSGGQYTGSTLDTEHDAATANMGEDWRMPTFVEIDELIAHTDHYYIGDDGNIVEESELDGSKLRSICLVKQGEEFNYNKRTNFIEFPFAGHCFGSLLRGDGSDGFVWSSSVYVGDVQYAYILGFSSDGAIDRDIYDRYDGVSVRGVRALD